ncbi:RdgB/HAM1 family non-canonical purine NTP pyrophosphatase [Erysipelothrix sp. HDW6A]|uniref:RdgB/HAM1 family non-canonical purine NTP pyrophosphatase n=1 Tax=Erysipelothrix sp. HDW6A TaxID=2714928 RepID=UPI00140CEBA6|nr:RdgB/HAM1 family non-canonical purine NTP pyrophosphatase [Erysipelothrix sp. HDW6A]QIK57362.1 RdgB/HAM1 family non-canonical purine NTP pyrophosphatase [Erysipelothrix sp. HDW6A]
MKLLIASHNKNKIKEFKEILEPLGYTVLSAGDFDINIDDVEETESTFEGNALLKARYLFEKTGLASISDDSGLTIPALPDILGVYSARFMGSDTDYTVKNHAVIDLLKDKEDRSAYFTSAIALVGPTEEKTFVGRIDGTITDEIRGVGGFGYDPIFLPDGYEETFGELGPEIKNTISHRFRALEKLIHYLREVANA